MCHISLFVFFARARDKITHILRSCDAVLSKVEPTRIASLPTSLTVGLNRPFVRML